LTLPERLGALARVAQVLDALDITYAVGGSVASARWGVPRLTNDIDIVLDLPPNKIGPLAAALEIGFFVDESSVREAVRLKRAFNILARDDFTKVDMFVADDQPWQRLQLARRRLEHLPPDISRHPVFMASPEDTVLAKLMWFEKGNRVSDRQWQDVRAVLAVQGPGLDLVYLRTWAAQLGVSELLEQALAQVADGGGP
jgi:hypothetical protein